MKDKFIKSASVFSKAIIQPVMFMAVTGIILSVCAILKLDIMPDFTKKIGDFIFNILSGGMIGQLSAIFCVGIATALAKPKYKTDAAIFVTAALEYFVFKKLIIKLNIPTLGREKDEDVSDSVVDSIVSDSDSEFEPQIQNIVAGLGGADNIENIINCYTRLRVDVKDENKVNIKILKEKVKASGIVDKGKHIQIIIGIGVEQEREKVEAYIEYLKKNK